MPNPLNLSKSEMEKLVGIGIGVVLVVFVLIQFVTIPSIRKSGELNKEIVKLKEDLERSEILIASVPQMQNRLAATQQKLNDYQTALPLRSEMPNILQNISGIAVESKVKLLKIEPLRSEKQTMPVAKLPAAKQQAKQDSAKTTQPIYTEMPIQIEARGSYHALGEFINKVETARNIMSIADVDIKRGSDDMFNHDARLLIIAYVLREETPAK